MYDNVRYNMIQYIITLHCHPVCLPTSSTVLQVGLSTGLSTGHSRVVLQKWWNLHQLKIEVMSNLMSEDFRGEVRKYAEEKLWSQAQCENTCKRKGQNLWHNWHNICYGKCQNICQTCQIMSQHVLPKATSAYFSIYDKKHVTFYDICICIGMPARMPNCVSQCQGLCQNLCQHVNDPSRLPLWVFCREFMFSPD